MDEVLDKLVTTTITENEDKKTNFDGLYKNWGKHGSQEERRRDILEVQKSNRNTKLDRFRGILELVNAVEKNDYIFNTHNKAYYRPSIYVAGFHKAATYSDVLMMSEWMVEKPSDFEENWLVVPCPKGTRILLVANNGRTKCYTKYGHFIFECRTMLPGGNPGEAKSHCCVLDCFYDKKHNTMYVLDILAWNSQPMTDGEAEFRHYWLTMQLADVAGLKTINKRNELIFSILPKMPCTPDSLKKFMMTFPHIPSNVTAMDGLLFYHKRAHYFAGQTPLVGWLYPYMVPEVLGADIEIHKAYLLEKPDNYTNQADFIQNFEEKNSKKTKKGRRTRNNSEMDTADATHQQIQADVHPNETESMEAVAVSDNKTEVMEAIAESEANTENMKVGKTMEPVTDPETKTDSMEAALVTETKTGSMEAAPLQENTSEVMETEPVKDNKAKSNNNCKNSGSQQQDKD